MVISAGGYFVKKGDSQDYQGGETRLVTIPAAARHQDLVDALDRVASGSITSASSVGLSQVRYVCLGMDCPSPVIELMDLEGLDQRFFESWPSSGII